METIRGKASRELTSTEFHQMIEDYEHIELDLGTGDGRFVRTLAARRGDRFVIGLDACRENLHLNSRLTPTNALFVIASAQALPAELDGLISQVHINFPWGSLLEGLLADADPLHGALASITRPSASIEIYLNGEALATAGWTLEAGADRIERRLSAAGWRTQGRACLDAGSLRAFPSTWARRLAFGRDPRAIHMKLQKE